jgi:hypothetical protein
VCFHGLSPGPADHPCNRTSGAGLVAPEIPSVTGHAVQSPLGAGILAVMEVDFVQLRDDGTVDARLGPGFHVFNEALADSISSIPPRGSTERHLSTYWIDQTLDRLVAMRTKGEHGRIASGNAYSIRYSGDLVTAVFDFGDDDSIEAMQVDEFIDLLKRWGSRVRQVQKDETREIPETYRRNPWP